jgi:hypothetical protein
MQLQSARPLRLSRVYPLPLIPGHPDLIADRYLQMAEKPEQDREQCAAENPQHEKIIRTSQREGAEPLYQVEVCALSSLKYLSSLQMQ